MCWLKKSVFGLTTFLIAAQCWAGLDLERQISFNIPAQQLDAALVDFSRQTKLQVVTSGEDVKTRKSGGVTGTYTIAEALQRLLNASGLSFKPVGESAISIGKFTKPAGTAAVDVSLLQEAGNLRVANAQQGESESVPAAEPSEDDQASTGEEVLVTGSRLKTSKSASPVTVITAEEIKRQGLSTVEDIIRSLPQNFSTINAAASLDNSINTVDARGQSAVDLRGLGPQNTLVLVNGRRRAVTSTFSSGIVNINTIPAGAIERVEVMTDGGSAVYGSDAVAGVINFILKKDYQGGETRVRQESASNDGDTFSADQTLGKSWSGGNVTMSGRYSKNEAVDTRKAGYTTADFTSMGGSDFRADYIGQPGVSDGVGSLPANDDGTHGIAGRLSMANVVPYDDGRFAQFGTTEGSNLTFSLNAEQKFGAHVNTYAEVSYSNAKSESKEGPPLVTFVDVPATNRFNDTGATVESVGYAFIEEYMRGLIPGSSFTSNQEALGVTLGSTFDLPFAGWTADISVGRSKEDAYFVGNGLDEDLLAQRVAGLDADGNPLPAAQHLNLFGNGTAQDPAALAGLMSPDGFSPASTNTSTLNSGLASFEGAVVKLPGGEMRLAMGAELRKEQLDFSSDTSRSTLFLVIAPEREVKAGFAEASIPIVGEGNRFTGVHSLDAFVAARREQYSVEGPFDGPLSPTSEVTFSRTSPKYGISWYVIPELKVRATVSDSFRAPQLSSLFSTTSGPYNFLPLTDPENPGDGVILPDLYFGGNPGLGPEISHNFTTGIDWKPSHRLQGLSVTLTYDKIDFTNRISGVTTLAFTQPGLLFDIPGIVERGPDGRISRINLISVNLAARDSESIDLLTTYDFTTRAGDITLGFTGTYALTLEDIAVPGADPIALVGTEDGPEKHKWRTWISWSRNEFGANLYANYSGHYTNSGGPNGPQPVDSYTTFDLNGFYRMERQGWSFNMGVRNLTDTKFPFFNGFGRPWDPRRVDTRGRTMYLEVAKKYGLFR